MTETEKWETLRGYVEKMFQTAREKCDAAKHRMDVAEKSDGDLMDSSKVLFLEAAEAKKWLGYMEACNTILDALPKWTK